MGEEDFISFSIVLIFFACKHHTKLKRLKLKQKKIAMNATTKTTSTSVDQPRVINDSGKEVSRPPAGKGARIQSGHTDCLRPEPPVPPATAAANREVSADPAHQACATLEENFRKYGPNKFIIVLAMAEIPDTDLRILIKDSPLIFDELCQLYTSGKLRPKAKKALENIMERSSKIPMSVDEFADELGYEIKDCGLYAKN
ncbi:MAG: hypothetical protein LBD33_00670 [Puniceicoccales bacterium]|jgi:hypothetical protein|nr:hypothetical protein [Puniceicoccales bacterium]